MDKVYKLLEEIEKGNDARRDELHILIMGHEDEYVIRENYLTDEKYQPATCSECKFGHMHETGLGFCLEHLDFWNANDMHEDADICSAWEGF